MEINKLYNIDCMQFMSSMTDECVDMTLTDIPYGEVNRASNGLRNLDKSKADELTFDLKDFCSEVYRVTKDSCIIFCGKEQFSTIHQYFSDKQKKHLGTVRQLIWEKSNPSPMNGQYIYLSGIENAVWFKKRGGVFNAHCKNTVFTYPVGRSKLHPTEKNKDLLKELLEDNSNRGGLIFDPCAGSGAHLLAAKQNGRNYIGCELNENYFAIAQERLQND